MARSQFALFNFRTDYHWSGQYLLGSKMAENLSKRPKRGILKSSTSFEQREYSPAPPVEPNFQQQRAPPSATGLLTTTHIRVMVYGGAQAARWHILYFEKHFLSRVFVFRILRSTSQQSGVFAAIASHPIVSSPFYHSVTLGNIEINFAK